MDNHISLYSDLYPVIYSQYRVSVLEQCLKELSGSIDKAILWDIYKYGLLAKSSEWKHQNEWRLVKFECEDNLFPFFPISKVYLGAKMNVESRKTIIDICKKKNIPYSGVIIQNNKYQIHDCSVLCEDCPKMK